MPKEPARNSPLAGLSHLKTLNLSNNLITDFSSIAELTNLTDLNLRSTQLSSLTAVAPLLKLTKLDVANNRVAIAGRFVQSVHGPIAHAFVMAAFLLAQRA